MQSNLQSLYIKLHTSDIEYNYIFHVLPHFFPLKGLVI